MEIGWWCQTSVKNWVMNDEWWVMEIEWWKMVGQTGSKLQNFIHWYAAINHTIYPVVFFFFLCIGFSYTQLFTISITQFILHLNEKQRESDTTASRQQLWVASYWGLRALHICSVRDSFSLASFLSKPEIYVLMLVFFFFFFFVVWY